MKSTTQARPTPAQLAARRRWADDERQANDDALWQAYDAGRYRPAPGDGIPPAALAESVANQLSAEYAG